MNEQAELNFSAPPEPSATRLPELCRALQGRGWQTAAELKALGFADRELRQIVEADHTGQIFSYPGSPGYKLWREVTLEEFRRADALKNQGEVMIARWARYQRRYHQKGLHT